MKHSNLISIGPILAISCGLIGCSTMYTPSGNMVDVRNTDFSSSMTVGESCANYLLGFIGPFGNSSVMSAAKSKNISKVELIDYADGYFLLFSQHCVVVYGKTAEALNNAASARVNK